MTTKQLSKEEIKKIINDEIKSFITSKLDDEVKKVIGKSSGQSRRELVDIIKKALFGVYKFMYIRKDIWGGDIK